MRKLAVALALWMCAVSGAHAVLAGEMLKDPALEARARALTAELRCVVCQGQSVDDSEAGIARDIRVIVRERLTAGDSDGAVNAYLVARYGNYILLKPPFDLQTALLWITPALALLLGGFAIVSSVRRSSRARLAPEGLAPAETARLQALLAREE